MGKGNFGDLRDNKEVFMELIREKKEEGTGSQQPEVAGHRQQDEKKEESLLEEQDEKKEESLLEEQQQEEKKEEGSGSQHMGTEDKDFVFQETVFVDELTEGFIQAETIKPPWTEAKKTLAQFATQGKATVEDGLLKAEDAEWKNVIKGKGSGKTTKELIVMMMARIAKIDDRLKTVEKRLENVEKNLENLHDAVSSIAERACRTSLTLFVQQVYPNCHVHQPILRLKLPYPRQASLEALISRCGKLKDKEVVARTLPDEAEVDLFLRATLPTGSPSPRGAFTHFAVAEVTKSVLCSSAEEYRHPPAGHMSLTKSSKLLYKLIQLECDICAALQHFSFSLQSGAVLGAYLLSPSFHGLFDHQGLLDAVFRECPEGFENLQYLHHQGFLWLIDM